jgi:hypothetical protein
MEVDGSEDRLVNGEVPSADQSGTSTPAHADEAAAKAAKKLAKKIISETDRLDPNHLPQDTGRTRRKVIPLPELL